MNTDEARRKGHAGGHVVQLGWSEGFTLYLTDYRRELDREGGTLTTPYPGGAEWFRYLPQARDAAARMRHATGQAWVVTTAPADAKPCRCKVVTSGAEAVTCPDCGHPLARPGIRSPLRCYRCDKWVAEPKVDAQYSYPHGRPCPDCGSESTARVGDALRCFRCGNAWRPGTDERTFDAMPSFLRPDHHPEDDGLTDEQVSMAARAAAETVFPELDDDSLDAIEAEIRSELRNVAGIYVP